MNNQPSDITPPTPAQLAATETQRHKVMENRARRAARSVELRAVKSRNRYIPNEGGFRLIHAASGIVITGNQYNLTAAEVIDFCLNTWPEESKTGISLAAGKNTHWPLQKPTWTRCS
jgi:hypothetical protein